MAATRDRAAAKRDEAAEAREITCETVDENVVTSVAAAPTDVVSSVVEHHHDDIDMAAEDRHAAADDRDAAERDREALSLDDLTGTYRRGPGFVELERDLLKARRADPQLVLAFVDVDGLKAVNDSGGHSAGDRLLRVVVESLRSQLRDYDLIVRYGGDEFLCSMPGVTMDEAALRVERVNAAMASTAEGGSVSVGLAELRPDDTLATLITRADGALYHEREGRAVAHTSAT